MTHPISTAHHPATKLHRRSRPIRIAGLFAIVALLCSLPLAMPVSAQATWLNQASGSWNQPGASVPTAPPLDSSVRAECRDQERTASGPEESALADAGWLLEEYWPQQQRGNTTLVMANSSYDGMCRPMGFNGFVFVDGKFAGTISPVNMDSRTDGVLQDIPTLSADNGFEATYLRYDPSDPLCCPSLPPTVVQYQIQQQNGSPVLAATSIGQGPTPQQLPRTGSPSFTVPLLGAGALLLSGLMLRFGDSRRSRARAQ